MPWSPDDSESPGDPRLDPFRERAGVLLDHQGEKVADLFLRAEQSWSRVSGHLWWSRWTGPQEVVHAHLLRDGAVTDRLISGDELDRGVDDWTGGDFAHGGTRHRVVWLDDEESERVRQQVFGLDGGPGSGTSTSPP